jgi:signal transduction histidine kinase
MKLFSKTLLFFVGVIAFQSILTLLLVANVTRQADLSDARRELDGEASILSDSFNSWKRQIWISLMGISNDRRLARVLADFQGYPPREDFTGALKEFIFVSKVDYVILGYPRSRSLHIIPVTYSTFDLGDFKGLSAVPQYSHIEFALIRGVLCMLGATTIDVRPNVSMNVFLLKRIDSEFCDQLTLNRKSGVAVFLDGGSVAGSLPSDLPVPTLEGMGMRGAYMEKYNEKVGGARYNIAVQWTGTLGRPPNDAAAQWQPVGGEIHLGTFLSNDPYNQRIFLVSRALFLVSVAGALLTIVVSLFLSRNITRPIADLLAAMVRIKSGAYDTQVGERGGYEIGRLTAGFDDMAREISQNRAAMQEYLRETVLLKEYNEKIIHSIQAGIAIVNRSLIVEKANEAFIHGFALDGKHIIGAPLTLLDIDIVEEGIVEKIIAVLRREKESFTEVKRSANGRVYEIKLYPFSSFEGASAEASGCVFIAEDISAKMELEHKIFQAEKLASISMLSAGMAHEINNPLGSILTNVQNLLDDETDPDRQVSLKWIEQETRRIARIVTELLKFSSPEAGPVPGSDVNAAVEQTVGLLRTSLAHEKRITIAMRLGKNLPLSAFNPDELRQVVINLLKNSIQAIQGSGRILVCTRLSSRAEAILLSIADTGAGIPRQIIPRIFDPFFTTKGNGEGTGLGLSVVYGIVAKHNGAIRVRSREGAGARLEVSLPLLQGAGT